jgi:hypothetical protein
MTHEDLMDWLVTLMNWAMVLMAVCLAVLIAGFIGGYVSETVAIKRADRCINSMCDATCKPNGRFVRHQGCTK